MENKRISIIYKIFNLVFLGYLAILPMSNTIALRNLLLSFLAGSVVIYVFINWNQLKFSLSTGSNQLPVVIFMWVGFLVVFPLFAVQTGAAWENFRGQWFQSILAWVVGFGAVLILGKRGPGLWALAFASSFSIILHLLLCIAALSGILSKSFFSHPTFISVFQSFSSIQPNTLTWQELPVGFTGVEPLHFNLGHAACQAIVLFSVCLSTSWRLGQRLGMLRAVFSITLCFLSLFIAQSRGAIIFGFIIILTSLLISTCLHNLSFRSFFHKYLVGTRFLFLLKISICISISLILIFVFRSIESQERWYSMIDKISIGIKSQNPVNILCDGISPQVEAQVRDVFSDRDSAYIQVLLDGLRLQDGGRILLMRAGADLVLENPRGLDGSKHSYQKLIKEKCGHEPVLHFSHAHQGWIDLALALGWCGVVLFACLLVYFLLIGWANMDKFSARPWAMGLFLMSAFWILRGFSDEVFREHYLQMQALVIAYLFWRLRLGAEG